MNKKVEVLVIGAGAAGLGSAAWLKKHERNFLVVEGAKELPLNLHNGVHYLHSIPLLPFETDLKRITLTDGILSGGVIHHKPNLEFSLQYSEKVREIQHPSSIMDIGKETEVYMPKSNSVNSTLQKCYDYAGADKFQFGWWFEDLDVYNKIAYFNDELNVKHAIKYDFLMSSVPLDKFQKVTNHSFIDASTLQCKPVYITNIKVERIVPNWMINLYTPDPRFPAYRVSILNGICSIESVKELTDSEIHSVKTSLGMFHFSDDAPERYTWNTGKVISISTDERRELVSHLRTFGIFQLGRFGLWNRKLLIDSTIFQAREIVNYFNQLEMGVAQEEDGNYKIVDILSK